MTAPTSPRLEVGHKLEAPARKVTPERVRWYGDGMFTAAAGQMTHVGSNIHTDEEYARNQGLPTAVADGMIATNWISSLLLDEFGADYLERGELRTKFIKPTPVGANVSAFARVTSCDMVDGESVRYELEVWTEDETGQKLTVGDAAIRTDR